MVAPLNRGRRLALLVAGAFFMEILDATVIAPAAPHVARDLGVSPVAVNLAITGYVLTLAVLIPISGWLTDRFGARRVFGTALLIFTVASAGCALAVNLPMLVGTRVLQGAGGALMVPVGRLVVLRTTEKTDLVRAVAYLTWPALAAPLVAPALGGVLSTYASWRWIFLINVPLGVVALVVARRVVPDVRGAVGRRLDVRGFLLVAGGLGLLVAGLETLEAPWLPVAGLSVLALAVVHLLRVDQPLVDLRVLRIGTFRATALGGSVFRAAITAVPFLLPLFFQLGFGWSAAEAGLVIIALFAGNIGIKPATTPLMRRFGIRTVMLGSVLASAACLAGMAALSSSTPLLLVLLLLLCSGIVRSTGFTTYHTIAFADVPQERMTGANTLLSSVQELGAGLGVAVGALLVRLGEEAGVAGDGAYRLAFALLAVLLVIPCAEAIRLPRSAGDILTGRR